MKIGIITIHNSPNYGACLQSFALWKYIANLGYETEIIDLHRPHQADYVASKRFTRSREMQGYCLRAIKGKLKKILGLSRPHRHLSDSAQAKFDAFNSQIRLSQPYRSIDYLYDNPPVYDIYISGSDQLWNPDQPFCLEPYFLTFAPQGKRKLSYASSVGITKLTEQEKDSFGEWLKSYDAISVRELQTKELIETLVGKNVEQVADPTFLLNPSDWKSMAIPPKRDGYLLLFTLQYDRLLLNYARNLGKESGRKVVYLTALQPESQEPDYEAVTNAGPREWLGLIGNAQMMITDSFHGTVFSLIMGTSNFFTYIAPTNKRGIRITELLETYCLTDHLLSADLDQTYDQLEAKMIDHKKVENIMENERNRSRQFLNDNLQ